MIWQWSVFCVSGLPEGLLRALVDVELQLEVLPVSGTEPVDLVVSLCPVVFW